MRLLTFLILSIYLKYVKAGQLTTTDNGSGNVTDDEEYRELMKENGYYEYNIEDEDHEVRYTSIQIITKLEFRIAVSERRRFWADGVVPYVLSKQYDSKETNAILAGMEAFKIGTCIRFIPRTSELVYIFIEPGRSCSATVGKFGTNGVKLGKGCYKKGIVIHELMHVLGFFHEQSRSDRDSFVNINYDNILQKHKKNFDKFPENKIQNGNISYDYDSIMHYGAFTFAKNKTVQTVIPLQEGVEIGQREDFSEKDLEKINLFYHCKPPEGRRRRRVKRHDKYSPPSPDPQRYFNQQDASLPVVVDSQYADRRKPAPASYPTNVRMVDYRPVRVEGEYSLPNYAPAQNPRTVYQPAGYPSSGYSLEARRRPSYQSAAYPAPVQAAPELYQWPSYSAVEQPKQVYSQARQPETVYSQPAQPKLVYPQAEQPQIVYPPAEQPKILYPPQSEPPLLQDRPYTPVKSRPAYSPVEYRGNSYRPTYTPVKYPRPSYTTAGYQRLPYAPLDYPKPVYVRPSYTTEGYRRPPYPPPYYNQDNYPSMYGYPPVEKPYTESYYETTALTINPLTSIATTTTEQESTSVMTITTLSTDSTTPTVTATTPVTTNQESTTLETTTPMDTTTTGSTVSETTTVITTEGTSTVVTSTIAETTTLAPTSTVADTTTAAPTSTVTETTTAVPTSPVTETTTTLPTSTVADTTTAEPTTTVTTTLAPTSTVTETMTAVPSTTVTVTTTSEPTRSVTETTTSAPTSTVTETTTSEPTSTVAETTTAVPTFTATETTTSATTEGSSTVPTSTQEITSTLFTTDETTTNTDLDIDNTKSTTIDYGYDKEYKPKYEYDEVSSRGLGGFVSDRDIHYIPYHRIRIFPNIQGRIALRDASAFWSRGIVPYEFSDKYDAQQKGFLLEAMDEFHNKTCVRFVPRKRQASYIFIEPEIKCSAAIGRVPGQVNRVRISEGCYLAGTIIHELMHTLGFVHEQNRPDRDQYVIVIFDNIIPDARKNFRKYTWEDVQDLGQSYDYDSVMHYSNVEFAVDPDRPTLVPLQPGVKIGQRDGFSKKDLIKVNKLYKCRVVQAREPVLSSPIEEFKKYFQSNIQRLFRNLLRAIQNFRPSKPKPT